MENSGPIGLSIMVVLSECYLQRIEHISITQALNLNLAPKTFKRFVDDSHARFNNREQSLQFLDILNSQDPSIQYTTEFENGNTQLIFLDVSMRSTGNNSLWFQNLTDNISNKCADKTKHTTTYGNGSIQRFSFTSIQNMYWKVSSE